MSRIRVGPFHVLICQDRDLYLCTTCMCVSRNDSVILCHYSIFHEDEKTDWECSACESQSGQCYGSALNHVLLYHNVMTKRNNDKPPRNPEDDYRKCFEELMTSCDDSAFEYQPPTKNLQPSFPFKLANSLSASSSMSAESIIRMVHSRTSFHFFKCMEVGCLFTTDELDVYFPHMVKHYRSHTDFHSTQSWRTCPYCGEDFETVTSLCSHLVRTHADSNFQCPYCCYRALTVPSLVLHQKYFHKSEEAHILQCNVLPMTYERTVRGEDWSMKAYMCGFPGCNYSSYAENLFRSHIVSSKHKTCGICKFEAKNGKELMDHFALHQISTFHCYHCGQGFSWMAEVSSHLAAQHSECAPTFFKRVTFNNESREEYALFTVWSIGYEIGNDKITLHEIKNVKCPVFFYDTSSFPKIEGQGTSNSPPEAQEQSPSDAERSSRCAAVDVSRKSFGLDYNIEPSREISTIYCYICYQLINSIREIEPHFKANHPEYGLQYVIPEFIGEEEMTAYSVACFCCSRVFFDESSFLEHFPDPSASNYCLKQMRAFKCPVCQQASYSLRDILDHVSTSHRILYYCHNCRGYDQRRSRLVRYCASKGHKMSVLRGVKKSLFCFKRVLPFVRALKCESRYV